MCGKNWLNLSYHIHIAFIALLDNYERETGRAEVVTQEEINENRRFIDLIMETEPMKIAHEVLAKFKKSPLDVRGFKHQLYQIWFELYSRTKGNRWAMNCFKCVTKKFQSMQTAHRFLMCCQQSLLSPHTPGKLNPRKGGTACSLWSGLCLLFWRPIA